MHLDHVHEMCCGLVWYEHFQGMHPISIRKDPTEAKMLRGMLVRRALYAPALPEDAGLRELLLAAMAANTACPDLSLHLVERSYLDGSIVDGIRIRAIECG